MRKILHFGMLIGLMFSPLLFADDGAHWLIELEGAWIEPSNLDSAFVIVDPVADGLVNGEAKTLDLTTSIAPKLTFGRIHANGNGWLLSYWTYQDDSGDADNRAATPVGGELWDILYHPEFSFDAYSGTAAATIDLEASKADLGYAHAFTQKDSFRGTWVMGLRWAELDRALGVVYTDSTPFSEFVTHDSQADGIGLFGGLKGRVKLAERFGITGGATYALLAGTIESRTLNMDETSFTPVDLTREEDSMIGILEVELALDFPLTRHWNAWVGYELSRWDNAVNRDSFPDDVAQGFLVTRSDNVTFSGFSVGTAVRF